MQTKAKLAFDTLEPRTNLAAMHDKTSSGFCCQRQADVHQQSHLHTTAHVMQLVGKLYEHDSKHNYDCKYKITMLTRLRFT